jgi:hypothetical protein
VGLCSEYAWRCGDGSLPFAKEICVRGDDGARAELERFAFLIGRYRCEARLTLPGGEQRFAAVWEGRWILDGRAIADEYRMFGADGEVIVLGLNVRAYDAAKKSWNIRWLDALSGRWTELGPEELGGVQFEGTSASYRLREPMAGHALTRATYTNISERHFTWKGEGSEDGKIWTEFMVVECERE